MEIFKVCSHLWFHPVHADGYLDCAKESFHKGKPKVLELGSSWQSQGHILRPVPFRYLHDWAAVSVVLPKAAHLFFFSPHCSWLTVFCQFFYCTSSVREGEKSFMPCQSQYLIYLSDFLLFLDCLSQAWEVNVNNTDLLYGCWGCLLLGSDCLPGRGGREVNLKRS